MKPIITPWSEGYCYSIVCPSDCLSINVMINTISFEAMNAKFMSSKKSHPEPEPPSHKIMELPLALAFFWWSFINLFGQIILL